MESSQSGAAGGDKKEALKTTGGKIESLVKLADALDKLPWGTILGGLIVVIAALVGGIIVVVGKSSLNFDSYVDDLSKLAIGVGLVAVGRGIHKLGKG
jgi:type III secretory pathway component EscV